MYKIKSDLLTKDVEKTDLIIIPALEGDMIKNLENIANLFLDY
jgi:hypothetical protein